MHASSIEARRGAANPVFLGAGRAFTTLLLGGAVQPLAASLSPALGMLWLPITAVAAFTLAGLPAGALRGPEAMLQGATGALLGYSLVIPVVAMAGAFALPQVAATSAVAVLTGAISARCASRKASA